MKLHGRYGIGKLMSSSLPNEGRGSEVSRRLKGCVAVYGLGDSLRD
jgi:hypothetical protein